MSERILRCAIVGAGGIAPEHAQAIASHPRARLVAVADVSRERAVSLGDKWGATAFDALDTLLTNEAPDVVILATPPGLHHDQTVTALRAGAHVVVEKPPAMSVAELDHMTQVAVAVGRRLAVVFQGRSGSAAAHIRSLLAAGEFGRPLAAVCETLWYRDADYYAVPWRGKWATEGGGTTLGHGIHQLDLLTYLLGDWQSVQARLWRTDRDIETEDVSTSTIRFANGAIAQAITSAVSPQQVSRIRIDTQLATISVTHLYGHSNENWEVTPAPHVPPHTAARWRFHGPDVASGHTPFMRSVFDALLDGSPFPPEAQHPARTFELVAAMYASARQDGAVITRKDVTDAAAVRSSLRSTVIDVRPPE
ncbi:Gfo/Idh/MocA family protein [Microbacterium sp. XT11]|uniref:Gfo/Idh/MocA family protein n=1 Tax=Microbacterium sp. XT11 TaxID=367477 RepID=UPI000742FD0B|nr:Gfo/Idh/MocA family oxidoreductase [Microbacterium sp. XT11]ALX66170.1 hypothetical protein AB663_001104 [Microbacterium sp. XT11]